MVMCTHLITPVIHFNVFPIYVNLISRIIDNGSYKEKE